MTKRSGGSTTWRDPDELAIAEFELDIESPEEFEAFKQYVDSFEYENPDVFETKIEQIKKIMALGKEALKQREHRGRISRQGNTLIILAVLVAAVLAFLAAVIVLDGFDIGGFRLPSSFYERLPYGIVVGLFTLLALVIAYIFGQRSEGGLLDRLLKAIVSRVEKD